ncbi:MAG: hypothetical protein JWP89_182 [Schlesneria sp.]|nr:hypothetical protein [Schlesneria sp.]
MDEYMHFYKTFLMRCWNDMGPEEYVFTLVTVGLVGWFMMRRAGSMT